MNILETPEKAIAAFERFTGLRVTIHDLERSLAPYLQPNRYAHYFGLCHKVKSSVYDPFCVCLEVDRVRRDAGGMPDGRWHICHAGMVDWVVPVIEDQKLVWMIFAGTRTPGPRLTRGHTDADSRMHEQVWMNDDLRPPPVDNDEAEELLEMLRQLAARLKEWREQSRHEGQVERRPPLQREHAIRLFVHQHCDRRIQVQDLADHLHLSRSRTAHLVKEVCGVGFVELVTAARLRRACELLRYTDDPVADIALRVSFGNVSHFHRVFKNRVGTTPRQYRLRFERG